jgi:hypothetical protein
MAAVGFDAAYPDLRLASSLNARGRELVARARSLCLATFDGAAGLVTTAFTRRADYVTSDPLATPAWRARLGASRLGGTAPAAPVFQYHGVLDELVPYAQAEATRDRWCAAGARVTWVTLPAAEHVLGAVEGVPLALAWLADRFAGRPVRTSSCSGA